MSNQPVSPTRRQIVLRGLVQGIGFRPRVFRLAVSCGVSGWVRNGADGLHIEVEGPSECVNAFEQSLFADYPPSARVDSTEIRSLMPVGATEFVIQVSVNDSLHPGEYALAPSDLRLCEPCRNELHDPKNRRYAYPFVSCTECGPRFTILESLPYDRSQTSLRQFAMCSTCEAEFHDPTNRRFHAHTIACAICGPQFQLVDQAAAPICGQAAVTLAKRLLELGKIVAVKGVGGFHLACDATNDSAVQELRQRKHRPAKPFAVMFRNIDAARAYATISDDEEQLLMERSAPIALVRRRVDLDEKTTPIASSVAPGCRDIGVLLPYSPIHELLVDDRPLVMTSGNLGEEPIATDNAQAIQQLSAIADAFLLHSLPILQPCDDSVVQVFDQRPYFVRRSRGYVPNALSLPSQVPALLAFGGDMKGAICVANQNRAILSPYLGDMSHPLVQTQTRKTIDHFLALHHIHPKLVACDSHPGYFSTAMAEQLAASRDVPIFRIQHHRAHVASLMVEQGLDLAEPLLAFCFDGTGYGDDGAIWGGEGFVTSGNECPRRWHLRYVNLPGADACIRHPYRTALAWLIASGIELSDRIPAVAACRPHERYVLSQQLAKQFNCVSTSSVGRLFDAVSSLIGVCQESTYEGQAAIELEHAISSREEILGGDAILPMEGYRFELSGCAIDPTPAITEIVDDVASNCSIDEIALKFHIGLARAVVEVAKRDRAREGISRVGLTGGVFQNLVLLRLVVDRLRQAGIEVFVHRQVPTNDGGLALGQAAIASKRFNQPNFWMG